MIIFIWDIEKKTDIIKALKKKKLKFIDLKENIFSETAKFLSEGKIIGWFQGGAEFGPRALGNRSILCKPFPIKMKDHLNINVKFREKFRPFAPAVLEEEYKKYFDITQKKSSYAYSLQSKKR